VNKKNNKFLGIAAIVGGVALVAALSQFTSSISIRSVPPPRASTTLSVTEPVVQGVPLMVRWQVPATPGIQTIEIVVRTTTQEMIVGTAPLAASVGTVTIPCLEDESVQLLVRDASTRELLGQQSITLLAPGPDCILR
jgi:hypothetical protein